MNKKQGSTSKLYDVLGRQTRAHTHIKPLQLTEANRADPDTLLKRFKDWTSPSQMGFMQQQPSDDIWEKYYFVYLHHYSSHKFLLLIF